MCKSIFLFDSRRGGFYSTPWQVLSDPGNTGSISVTGMISVTGATGGIGIIGVWMQNDDQRVLNEGVIEADGGGNANDVYGILNDEGVNSLIDNSGMIIVTDVASSQLGFGIVNGSATGVTGGNNVTMSNSGSVDVNGFDALFGFINGGINVTGGDAVMMTNSGKGSFSEKVLIFHQDLTEILADFCTELKDATKPGMSVFSLTSRGMSKAIKGTALSVPENLAIRFSLFQASLSSKIGFCPRRQLLTLRSACIA